MKKLLPAFLLALFLFPAKGISSPGDTVIFTSLGHYYYDTTLSWSCYSPLIDRMGRPYVYGASIDLGMVTFDISNLLNPFPMDTLTPAELGGFGTKATWVQQQQDTLYVATGGFQFGNYRAGLTTWDFTNPNAPVFLDKWDSAAFMNGCSQVLIQGNYAYLAAMENGVIILDITDASNIRFVSQLTLSTLPNTGYTPNARGLFLSNDTLVVSFDGGGVRIVDVSTKSAPVQIGAFLDPAPWSQDTLYSFYNHAWCNGRHCFFPIDYAGLEVVDISSPAAMQSEAYQNIWSLHGGIGPWYGADGHTNEIAWTGASTNVLMISGADSQVLAYDPSDPAQPRMMGWWGAPNTDNLAAWGIDEYNGLVVCGYIRDVFANQPYYSTYGGIQLLSWTLITDDNNIEAATPTIEVYPNPASGICTIALPGSTADEFTIEVVDVAGRVVMTQVADPLENGRNAYVDVSALTPGAYFINVSAADVFCSKQLLVQ